MTMSNCPGCNNHCPLSNPGCEKGEEYRVAAFSASADEVPRGRSKRGGRVRGGGPQGRGEGHACGGGPFGRGDGHRHMEHLRGHLGFGENGGFELRHEGRDGKLFSLITNCGNSIKSHPEATSGQSRIIKILDRYGPMDQRDLQYAMQIQPGSLSELLAKLENKGYILRRRSEYDQRRWVVELTDTGADTLEYAQGAGVSSGLTDEERNQLCTLLEKLLKSLRDER